AVLAAAAPTAPWRAALAIPEPSARLVEALASTERVTRTALGAHAEPTLLTALDSIPDTGPDEGEIEQLTRRVLRSTLEQRQMRRTREDGDAGRRLAGGPGAP